MPSTIWYIRMLHCTMVILTLFGWNAYCQDERTYESRDQRNKASEAHYDKGQDYYSKGEFEIAILQFDSAIALNLRRIDFYVSRAEARESLGDHLGALVDYESAVRLDSDDPNLRFKRGLIYQKLKNYELAVEDFDYLMNWANFNETTAIIFKGVQHNEGGAAEFAGITTIDKMKSDVLNARGQCRHALGLTDKALNDFDWAIRENNQAPAYYVNRGLCHIDRKDTASAKSDYISALTIQPGYKSALFNLAKIASEEERSQLNKELYEDNEISVVFSQRAYEKFLGGDYQGAILDYDSAIFWDPKNSDDFMNRGIVKSKLKMSRSAISDFKKSLELNQLLVRNYSLIGNALQQLKSYQEAIEFYQLYLLKEGADAQVLYNKGIAELTIGERKTACEDLSLALNLGEKRAEKPKKSACEPK